MPRALSLRAKLVLALLGVGVLTVALTGGESYRRARRAQASTPADLQAANAFLGDLEIARSR